MQTDALRELPDMSNGNRTRKTTCDIRFCLRKFLCWEVNILKLDDTIPNSIYFCIRFCDRGSGKCCCISKSHFFLDARCVVCFELLLDTFWCIHSSLPLYIALSKEFAIEILLKNVATEETKKSYDLRHDYPYRTGYT